MSSGLVAALACAALLRTGGVWNPEDMVPLPASPWGVVSAMRSKTDAGALRLVDLRRPDRPATALRTQGIDPRLFSPHGLGTRAIGANRVELLVVDHGGGEAIDRFTLDTAGRPKIIGAARVVMPRGTSGNGVASLPDGGFVVTSMFDPAETSTLTRFAAGQPTGSLWRWSKTDGWRSFGPPLSGANGIAVVDAGRTIYATEWAGQRIWKMRIDGTEATSVPVSFLPDNLHIDGGKLRVAGQIGRPEQVYGCEARGLRCPMGYVIAQLDLPMMHVNILQSVDDDQARRQFFGGATGFLQAGAFTWLTSFTGKRLAYCKE